MRALATVLPPSAVFSHTTAAQLLRLPVRGARDVIHVTTSLRATGVVRPGVRGHRATIRGVTEIEGIRVTDAPNTWADLAWEWRLDDLVVLGEAIAMRDGCGLERLWAESAARAGRRGVHAMREALTLIRVGSASPMESTARLVMARAGLPPPELNRDILHPRTREWIARPDFSWPELMVAAEYDGDHHRTDRSQWRKDIARRRLLEEAGWRVIVFTADDVLHHPDRLVAALGMVLV